MVGSGRQHSVCVVVVDGGGGGGGDDCGGGGFYFFHLHGHGGDSKLVAAFIADGGVGDLAAGELAGGVTVDTG